MQRLTFFQQGQHGISVLSESGNGFLCGIDRSYFLPYPYNALLSCFSPRIHLNAADGAELCALAAAYASFRLHSGVASTAHLDEPQWIGIFAHAAGNALRLIYGSQFL